MTNFIDFGEEIRLKRLISDTLKPDEFLETFVEFQLAVKLVFPGLSRFSKCVFYLKKGFLRVIDLAHLYFIQ